MTEKVIELTFCWKDKSGRTGRFSERIPALQHRSFYRPFYRWGEQLWQSACQARCQAFNARSLVAFMDAAGLRESRAWKTVLRSYTEPSGFDHSRIWQDRRSGKFLVVTEPYCDKLDEAVAYCTDTAWWDCHVMPEGVGMWNSAPPRGTRMLLVCPGKLGAPLAPIVAALEGCMPVADEDYREGFPEDAFDVGQ